MTGTGMALKVLGYVNKFNRGIARVQEELIGNSNGEASFNVDNITVFEVKIAEANKETNKEKSWLLEPYSMHRMEIQEDMVDKYIGDLTGVTYRPTTQIALIGLLEEMSDKIACSSMEVFEALGVSRQTYNYKRHINPLLDSHIIAKKRTNNYYITALGRLYLMYLKKIYA